MALMAAGSMIQGVGGLKAGNAAYKSGMRSAREAENVAADESLRIREEARRAIGQQLAGQSANGFTGGTGSALDAVLESQINAALDAMTAIRDGANRAQAYRADARARRSEGRMALVSGLIGAGKAVAGGMDDWAQARRGSTPAPSSGGGDIVVTRGGPLPIGSV